VNIIIFGPPGAGKGTQSDKIVKSFNLFKISTGDLLREEIKYNTDLGIKIKNIIDKGSFVSDKIISDLITKILSDKKFDNRIIFDGYPRNLTQAKELDSLLKKYSQEVSCVVNLNVDKDSIIKRILGRVVCSNCGLIFNKYFNTPDNNKHKCELKYLKTRTDDNEETIKKRYETYLKETLPILNYYDSKKILHHIDGMKNIDEIYKEICGIITPLEAWLCKLYLYK